MDTNVTPVAFPGDPGHEMGSKPMAHLKGSMGPVHTQQPDLQETNSGSAVGSPSDTSGDITGWNTTTLDSTGGAHSHTSDTARTKST